MSQKYCIIDTETTGTDRIANNVWQISGMIVDGAETGYKILEAFDLKFRPFPGMIDPEAMEKTGMTPEKLGEFELGPEEAYSKLIDVLGRHCDKFNKLDKLQFVGYNSNFDSEFLRVFFDRNGDKYFGSWFWTPSICVMQNSAMALVEHRHLLPNFRLSTICLAAELEWDESQAHDARYDIFKTYELFRYLTKNK